MAKHDTAWKLLFSYPEMVRDLLAEFVPPEWVGDLDLSALTRGSEGQVTDDARERHPDRVWEVGLRGRAGSVLVLIEFQSTVDPTMAMRVLVYTGLLYQDRLRRSSDELPPVLPIVVYYGAGEWMAQEEVAGLCAAPGAPRASYQPSQRHFVLDVDRYTGPLHKERNWMAEIIRLARSPDLKAVAEEYRSLCARWPEPKHDKLIEAVWTWIGQVHLPIHNIKLDLPELVNAREGGAVLQQVIDDWPAKWREEGRAEGQAEVVRRMAARKFGAETAERLAGRLAEVTDPERSAEVGEWLLECDSGEELLDRVARLCESSTTGNGAAPS